MILHLSYVLGNPLRLVENLHCHPGKDSHHQQNITIIATIAKIIIVISIIIIITVTSLEIPAVREPEKQVETLQLSPGPTSTFNCHFLLHLWMCHSVFLPFSTPVFLCFSMYVFQHSSLKFCRRPCRLQLELGISICICDRRRSSFRATRNVKVLLIF